MLGEQGSGPGVDSAMGNGQTQRNRKGKATNWECLGAVSPDTNQKRSKRRPVGAEKMKRIGTENPTKEKQKIKPKKPTRCSNNLGGSKIERI